LKNNSSKANEKEKSEEDEEDEHENELLEAQPAIFIEVKNTTSNF
jgi:hypothetical protein